MRYVLSATHFSLVNRKLWTVLVRLRNSANVLAARSKLTLHLQVISRALFTGALFCVWLPAQATNCAPHKISESAKVKYVHDGDTVHLQDGRKLRLIGINTPELARNRQPEQAFAQQARLKLMELLRRSNYQVMLEFGPEPEDRYQRTLAHIYLPDGSNIQQALLAAGMATAITIPPNATQSTCYRQAESEAQKARRGIWQLAEYQIQPVASLSKRDRGFRIIQGRVSRISSNQRGSTLFLDNRVRLQIRKSDLIFFPPGYLESLKSRQIVVRGWLHTDKQRYFMSLRHPDAISQ